MFYGIKTIRHISDEIRRGNRPVVANDTAVQDGWHIDIGGQSFCGYKTRRDAREAVQTAREWARQ